jgi:hypothetical protein
LWDAGFDVGIGGVAGDVSPTGFWVDFEKDFIEGFAGSVIAG